MQIFSIGGNVQEMSNPVFFQENKIWYLKQIFSIGDNMLLSG